jgi:hypothetical protein
MMQVEVQRATELVRFVTGVCLAHFCVLKPESVNCSKASVKFYHTSGRHVVGCSTLHIQGVPGGKVNNLGGRSIGYFKHVHV